MTTIDNHEQFSQMLAEKQVVLFIYFSWSGQAVLSWRLFESWTQEWQALHRDADVRFYRLDPDAHPETWSWITKQARSDSDNERGFGSVTWLRSGRSVAFVRYAAEIGRHELSRLTDEHFGRINGA